MKQLFAALSVAMPVAFASLLLLSAVPSGPASAQDKPIKPDYQQFHGIVRRVPPGGIGMWVIGGRNVESTRFTSIDDSEGPLEPGVCAAVDMKPGGKAIGIRSLPAAAC